MHNPIHIPDPCSERWNGMQKVDPCKRHCAVCKTNVHDFTKKSLAEINETLIAANGEKLCGNYHERHTGSSKKLYVVLNGMERVLQRAKLGRVSILIVAASLFLSGCYRKQVRGRTYTHAKPTRNL